MRSVNIEAFFAAVGAVLLKYGEDGRIWHFLWCTELVHVCQSLISEAGSTGANSGVSLVSVIFFGVEPWCGCGGLGVRARMVLSLFGYCTCCWATARTAIYGDLLNYSTLRSLEFSKSSRVTLQKIAYKNHYTCIEEVLQKSCYRIRLFIRAKIGMLETCKRRTGWN